MSFPQPLMTTRAARIAIPCCSTYRHGHEQRITRAESFFFSSRRRHTRCGRDWSQTCALPICSFFVTFRASGSLSQIEDVVRLVRIEICCTTKPANGQLQSILIKIDHRQTSDSHRFVFAQGQSSPKFLE